MKKLQTLLAVAMGSVLLNAGLNASAQAAKPGYATVVRVKGEVMYSLDNGATKHPLVAGKYLEAGATVYTGADGVTDIVLGKSIDLPQAKWVPEHISLAVDSPVRGLVSYRPSQQQNAVRLAENTTLKIDKLTTQSSAVDAVSDTELDLQKGSMYASVKKLSAAAQYLVKTPTGIAGVRGTEFSICLNADGSIKSVSVLQTHNDDGLVLAITSATTGQTETFVIQAGQVYLQGHTSPISMTPQQINTINQIIKILRTPFFQIVSFDNDRTTATESGDIGSSF